MKRFFIFSIILILISATLHVMEQLEDGLSDFFDDDF